MLSVYIQICINVISMNMSKPWLPLCFQWLPIFFYKGVDHKHYCNGNLKAYPFAFPGYISRCGIVG